MNPIVSLSDDILSPSFDRGQMCRVKVALTVFNGHVVHEDFTTTPKVLDFGN